MCCCFFLLQSFVDVMKEFLKGRPSPSDLIFNDPNFSGVTFKKILEENDKLELVEMTMLALLHVSHPIYWASLYSNGNSLMTIKYFSLFCSYLCSLYSTQIYKCLQWTMVKQLKQHFNVLQNIKCLTIEYRSRHT